MDMTRVVNQLSILQQICGRRGWVHFLCKVNLPVKGLFRAPLVAVGNSERGAFAWLVGWRKTLGYW